MKCLEIHHDVIDILGISPDACAALEAGFCAKGTMPQRILIPLRLPTGKLVGYVGIATKADQTPLLLFPENLDERIGVSGTVEEPEVKSQDEMRKLLRVV